MLFFSSYRASVERAKASVCISNLKQLAVALSLYRQDYGEFPPNSETWPGFLSYLGGAPLECPVRWDRVNYFIHASFKPRLNAMIGNEYDALCMQERGPEYPIAHDSNHSTALRGYYAGTRFYLFVRLDGSVGRRDAEIMEKFIVFRDEFPCPNASWWSNF